MAISISALQQALAPHYNDYSVGSNSVQQQTNPNAPMQYWGQGLNDSVHFSDEAAEDRVNQDGVDESTNIAGSHDSTFQDGPSSSVNVNGKQDEAAVLTTGGPLQGSLQKPSSVHVKGNGDKAGVAGIGSHLTVDGNHQNVQVDGNGITATDKNGKITASGSGGKTEVKHEKGGESVVEYAPKATHKK